MRFMEVRRPLEIPSVPFNMVPVRFPDRHETSFSSHSVIRCHRPTSTHVSFTALWVRAGAFVKRDQNPRLDLLPPGVFSFPLESRFSGPFRRQTSEPAKPGEITVKEVRGKTFMNARVPLDDIAYVGCTFISCTFLYSATGVLNLSGNHITGNTNLEFSGAAADTLTLLQAVYRDFGDWGRETILKTFQQIAPDLKKLN